FKLPEFVQTMLDNKWLGSKSGQGFYKKRKDKSGKSTILELNLDTLEYQESSKTHFDTLELTKQVDRGSARFPSLIGGKDKAAEFYRKNFASLFAYVQNRIPEISDELYRIDDAMKAGFGWQHGPFEIWDAVGVEKGIELMKAENLEVAEWVTTMLD